MNIIKCTLCQCDSKLMVLNSKLESTVLKLLSIELENREGEVNLICSACCITITKFNKYRKRIRKLQRTCERDQKCEADSTINEDKEGIIPTSTAKEPEHRLFVNNRKTVVEISHSDSKVQIPPVPIQIPVSLVDYVPNEPPPEESQIAVPQTTIPACSKCSYKSNDYREFSRHIRSHCQLTKEQKICSKCFTVCDSMKLLYEHRRTVHPDEPVKYQCKEPDCFKIFSEKAELLMHQQLKHPKRPSKCRMCHQKFQDKLSLKVHRCRLKKFECPKQCGKRFGKEEELKRHFKKCRPGSSIFKCCICQKILSCLQTLRQHQKKCSTIDKKSASIPGKKFSTDVIQTTVEEPSTSKISTNIGFKSLEYSLDLNSVTGLEVHYPTCNGDYSKSIKCSHCGKSFINEKSLQIHLIIDHPNNAKQNCENSLGSEATPKSVERSTTNRTFEVNHTAESTWNSEPTVVANDKMETVIIEEESELLELPSGINQKTKTATNDEIVGGTVKERHLISVRPAKDMFDSKSNEFGLHNFIADYKSNYGGRYKIYRGGDFNNKSYSDSREVHVSRKYTPYTPTWHSRSNYAGRKTTRDNRSLRNGSYKSTRGRGFEEIQSNYNYNRYRNS